MFQHVVVQHRVEITVRENADPVRQREPQCLRMRIPLRRDVGSHIAGPEFIQQHGMQERFRREMQHPGETARQRKQEALIDVEADAVARFRAALRAALRRPAPIALEGG